MTLKYQHEYGQMESYVHEALGMAIEALFAEPCDDAVSRQAVLNILFYKSDGNGEVKLSNELRDRIRRLSPVTPKQKMGRWIKISPADIYECSECGQNVMTSDICAYKFCHGCGAKMEEGSGEE